MRITTLKIYIICGVILIIGMALWISAYIYIKSTVDLKRDRVLSSIYSSVHGSLQREIERNLNSLYAIRANFLAHNGMGVREFSDYADYYTTHIKSIQALEWVPVIEFAKRDSFELAMQKIGFDNFQITERKNGGTVRAEDRPKYYPVTYIHPFEGNEEALGFDPGDANPTRQITIEKSIGSEEAAASDIIHIIQKEKPHQAILVFVPVVNRENLKVYGLIEGVYLMEQLIDAAITDLDLPEKVNISIFDSDMNGQPLYGQPLSAEVHPLNFRSGELKFADRSWKLNIHYQGNIGTTIIPAQWFLIGALIVTFLFVKVVYDVLTDNRKELQKNIRELEQKNQDLEQYAYAASHDLQEPLHSMQSLVGLMEQDYHDKFDELGRKYLQHIRKASKRMGALITSMLQYSKIGQAEKSTSVDCEEVLDNVLEGLDALIKEKNAQIIRNDKLPTLPGYPVAIEQLFQNLISNAIKFQREDNVPTVKISCEKIRNYWKFIFEDNGIGFSEEHEELLFIIFKRLHTRSEFQGTGIGLAICKRIVELHEGEIWAHSEEGKGSQFCFTLKSN